jgi:hypothetical protein
VPKTLNAPVPSTPTRYGLEVGDERHRGAFAKTRTRRVAPTSLANCELLRRIEAGRSRAGATARVAPGTGCRSIVEVLQAGRQRAQTTLRSRNPANHRHIAGLDRFDD